MTEPLLNARAVAELLDLSVETVFRWVKAGKLPAIRLPGGAIRFRESEIDAWLDERATPRRGVRPTTPDAARFGRYSLASPARPTTEDEE